MYALKESLRSAALTTIALSSLITATACGSCGPAPVPPGGPVVTDATVRSCDILLQVDGDEVPAVEFADGVRGQSIPQAPRLAISFAARADASLQGGIPFTFRFKGAAGALTIVSEQCFDSAGVAVAGTPVELQ